MSFTTLSHVVNRVIYISEKTLLVHDTIEVDVILIELIQNENGFSAVSSGIVLSMQIYLDLYNLRVYIFIFIYVSRDQFTGFHYFV
jgi:hypothetical protein